MKKRKISNSTCLLSVKPIMQHIEFLYDLLKKRNTHDSISHRRLPSLRNHKKFVINNPYRYWFIIEKLDIFIGSAYVTKNNSIAIHLTKKSKIIYEEVLIYLEKNIKPLKAIPSVRSSNFIINLSDNNKFYANIINKLGGKKIQETYSLKNDKKKY